MVYKLSTSRKFFWILFSLTSFLISNEVFSQYGSTYMPPPTGFPYTTTPVGSYPPPLGVTPGVSPYSTMPTTTPYASYPSTATLTPTTTMPMTTTVGGAYAGVAGVSPYGVATTPVVGASQYTATGGLRGVVGRASREQQLKYQAYLLGNTVCRIRGAFECAKYYFDAKPLADGISSTFNNKLHGQLITSADIGSSDMKTTLFSLAISNYMFPKQIPEVAKKVKAFIEDLINKFKEEEPEKSFLRKLKSAVNANPTLVVDKANAIKIEIPVTVRPPSAGDPESKDSVDAELAELENALASNEIQSAIEKMIEILSRPREEIEVEADKLTKKIRALWNMQMPPSGRRLSQLWDSNPNLERQVREMATQAKMKMLTEAPPDFLRLANIAVLAEEEKVDPAVEAARQRLARNPLGKAESYLAKVLKTDQISMRLKGKIREYTLAFEKALEEFKSAVGDYDLVLSAGVKTLSKAEINRIDAFLRKVKSKVAWSIGSIQGFMSKHVYKIYASMASDVRSSFVYDLLATPTRRMIYSTLKIAEKRGEHLASDTEGLISTLEALIAGKSTFLTISTEKRQSRKKAFKTGLDVIDKGLQEKDSYFIADEIFPRLMKLVHRAKKRMSWSRWNPIGWTEKQLYASLAHVFEGMKNYPAMWTKIQQESPKTVELINEFLPKAIDRSGLEYEKLIGSPGFQIGASTAAMVGKVGISSYELKQLGAKRKDYWTKMEGWFNDVERLLKPSSSVTNLNDIIENYKKALEMITKEVNENSSLMRGGTLVSLKAIAMAAMRSLIWDEQTYETLDMDWAEGGRISDPICYALFKDFVAALEASGLYKYLGGKASIITKLQDEAIRRSSGAAVQPKSESELAKSAKLYKDAAKKVVSLATD